MLDINVRPLSPDESYTSRTARNCELTALKCETAIRRENVCQFDPRLRFKKWLESWQLQE